MNLAEDLRQPLLPTSTSVRMHGAAEILKSVLFYAAIVAGTLAVWQIAASFTNALFLPPPRTVFLSALQLLKDGTLTQSVGVSTARIVVGWILGSTLGIPVGLLMGRSALFGYIFDPFLQIFRFLPAIAILPLLILWLGSGESSKIAVIIYASCFSVALTSMHGARTVAKEKIRAAQCLGASSRQVFWLVVLPATAPHAIIGMRLGMAGAILGIVSAEMLAANEGLGFLINNSRLFMLTAHIFVAIVCLGLLGFALDSTVRMLSERLGYRFQLKS